MTDVTSTPTTSASSTNTSASPIRNVPTPSPPRAAAYPSPLPANSPSTTSSHTPHGGLDDVMEEQQPASGSGGNGDTDVVVSAETQSVTATPGVPFWGEESGEDEKIRETFMTIISNVEEQDSNYALGDSDMEDVLLLAKEEAEDQPTAEDLFFQDNRDVDEIAQEEVRTVAGEIDARNVLPPGSRRRAKPEILIDPFFPKHPEAVKWLLQCEDEGEEEGWEGDEEWSDSGSDTDTEEEEEEEEEEDEKESEKEKEKEKEEEEKKDEKEEKENIKKEEAMVGLAVSGLSHGSGPENIAEAVTSATAKRSLDTPDPSTPQSFSPNKRQKK